MKKYIWIIGAARSGTSCLAKHIGKFTTHSFVESNIYHPLNLEKWQFPEPYDSVSFKLNNNFVRANTLADKFKNSYFVHIFRDPRHVLYSMVHPKAGSWPERLNWKNDFIRSTAYWEHFMTGCLELSNINIAHIKYESIPENIDKLSEFVGMDLGKDVSWFKNRDDEFVDKDYMEYLEKLWNKEENALYLKLRKKVDSLASFWTSKRISML
jgi:hypothetical protein